MQKLITLTGTIKEFLFVYKSLLEHERVSIMKLVQEGVSLDTRITLPQNSEADVDFILRQMTHCVAVPSRSRPLDHMVTVANGSPVSCTCEAFTYGNSPSCYHMAVAAGS